ncbi:GNAT family N-acetyltransferase [Candidatus Chloroploca sp. Khr17]|uniref:GNAT family N-acetyltransferase n=1 Tax=Candidatus Chloroploca sp. Khr17 TaxID=2496869 RepID=UPI00101E0F03|nr:GNAT family N-acetyltransferase [Candidatus Chloroploca sp. Khr17]NCC32542.1 GNAT family N-acetyltransferase [Chloroflexia bacterium]
MKLLKTIESEFWWYVARHCDYATFFHTPLWQELALRMHPEFADASVGFISPRGVHAVLPLLATKRMGPLQSLLSTFEYCYGGIIADGELSDEDVTTMYQLACDWNVTGMRLLENPIAPRLDLSAQFQGTGYHSYIVKLDADFDTVFGRFAKSQRNAYRKGIKEGVTIDLVETLDDYRAYYGVYQDTIQRWGEDPSTYGYGWDLFATIFEYAQQYPETIKLWVARIDGEIVGGTIGFYWQRHVVAWHGCIATAYLKHKTNVVLDTEIIRDALARGYAYYDFNPTGDLNPGIDDYKKRLGSTIYPVTSWQYENALVQQARQRVATIRQMVSR